MLDSHSAYQASGSNIVHDILDGEAVVLNLTTGVFYSLLGTATEVWAGVQQTRSVNDIVDRMGLLFEGQGSDIRRDVEAFFGNLLQEKLIVACAPDTSPWSVPTVVEPRPKFEAPQAVRYDDVEELLLLDPVHEADTAGWPVPKPPT